MEEGKREEGKEEGRRIEGYRERERGEGEGEGGRSGIKERGRGERERREGEVGRKGAHTNAIRKNVCFQENGEMFLLTLQRGNEQRNKFISNITLP
jgi:hypothetical protein